MLMRMYVCMHVATLVVQRSASDAKEACEVATSRCVPWAKMAMVTKLNAYMHVWMYVCMHVVKLVALRSASNAKEACEVATARCVP